MTTRCRLSKKMRSRIQNTRTRLQTHTLTRTLIRVNSPFSFVRQFLLNTQLELDYSIWNIAHPFPRVCQLFFSSQGHRGGISPNFCIIGNSEPGAPTLQHTTAIYKCNMAYSYTQHDALIILLCFSYYRVAKTHRIPYLYRSFFAKVTYI